MECDAAHAEAPKVSANAIVDGTFLLRLSPARRCATPFNGRSSLDARTSFNIRDAVVQLLLTTAWSDCVGAIKTETRRLWEGVHRCPAPVFQLSSSPLTLCCCMAA